MEEFVAHVSLTGGCMYVYRATLSSNTPPSRRRALLSTARTRPSCSSRPSVSISLSLDPLRARATEEVGNRTVADEVGAGVAVRKPGRAMRKIDDMIRL